MKSSKQLTVLISILFLTLTPLFFNNCSKPPATETVAPSTAGSPGTTQTGSTDDINKFTKNPPVLTGQVGFQFLLEQYLGPRCGGCHDNKLYFRAPFFDLSDSQKSYDLSLLMLKKDDMITRITNNPFCPGCKLNPDGEVYKGIMYWLDHR